MNIILLSGGSGKRLWPLSNEIRSKQFLKLIKRDDGELESMIQRVCRQINESLNDQCVLVTSLETQFDAIKNQLQNEVETVLEPERRNTFPAIALACSYLFFEKNKSKDDVVVVLPVDPYTELTFFKTLAKLEKLITSEISKVALIGIKPTYPSAKYGYICPKGQSSVGNLKYYKVQKFIEKPDETLASELIEAGSLWNGGVFAFKLGYIFEKMSKYIQFSCFGDVYSQYTKMPKTSFDYEVLEKENDLSMVEYNGIWKDLGTWNTLTEVMDEHSIGRVILSETSQNTHVINELNIPVVVIGASNSVVVASPDGILVSDKNESSFLKKYIEKVDQIPMYEEKIWGTSKVLDYVKSNDGTDSITKSTYVDAQKSIHFRLSGNQQRIWIIIQGSGEMKKKDQTIPLKRGNVIQIIPNVDYSLFAESEMQFIDVSIGNELSESSVVFFEKAQV